MRKGNSEIKNEMIGCKISPSEKKRFVAMRDAAGFTTNTDFIFAAIDYYFENKVKNTLTFGKQ